MNAEKRLSIVESLKNTGVCLPKTEECTVINNFVVFANVTWDTDCSYGRYCSPSSVTDYSVRRTYIFDTEKMKIAGSSYERNLFRTTERGVIGHKYDNEISSVEIKQDGIEVVFKDGYHVMVKFKPTW